MTKTSSKTTGKKPTATKPKPPVSQTKKSSRQTTATKKKPTQKRPVGKSTGKKKPALRIPVHIWYETSGVLILLAALIAGLRLGSIGEGLFAGLVFVFGAGFPLVLVGIIALGGSLIWYQNRLRFTWKWGIYAVVGLSILLALSAAIAPNQSLAEFELAVKQLQQENWEFYLQTRGGVIGVNFFAMLQPLLGTVGTLLVALTVSVLAILFLQQRSLATSIEKTVATTKRTVDRAQQQVSEWQENKRQATEAAVIYDVEATQTPVTGLFPDEIFGENLQITDEKYENGTNETLIHLPIVHERVQEASSEVKPITSQQHERTNSGQTSTQKPYQNPPIHLLQEVKATDLTQMKTVIDTNIDRLQQIFSSFKIGVTISAVNVGPAITQYEVQPEPGIKVSRIVNLADDIALGLAAKDVRIVAPIPGKAAIGIEVPNPMVAMVSLKQVLEPTLVNMDEKLLVALGKDISGKAITAHLDKMPHLLVAGSTGSGKSVCINGIITSLLMRATPHEVKLLLIDPKKVELSYFNHIPHLLAPVVTDPKKAAVALRKIVQEMEERYEAFATAGVRNIAGFNDQQPSDQQMPFIVVIIDELADLMLVASKDVEESIMRITQMARAAGIHLIVATQRPSVDVITGVIKANIPSRIAFAVSSQIDSRTILDMGGAEALVGKGDMLFFPSGESKPLRVQGAYVSETEVLDVVDFIKGQEATIVYDEQLLALEQTDIQTFEAENEATSDELLPEVIQFVVEQQKASTSMIQRRFKVGYNRAARLMEMMEGQAIIGPNEGTKPRQVLKTTATYQIESEV